MSPFRPLRLLTLAAIAVVAACHADSAVGPSEPATLDGVLAEMSLPAITQPLESFNVISSPADGLLASTCGYSSATQRFECLSLTTPTDTLTQWFMLLDAAGAPQSSWNAGTTEAVRLYQAVHAHVVSATDSANINALQDLTVSGLRSGPHTLNGTQIVHIDEVGTTAGASSHFVTDVSQQLTNVVLNSSATPASAWPLSGTLTSDVTESGNAFPTHVHTVITFTGTSRVQVTITINGVSTAPCTVDLSGPFPNCK